MKLASHNSLSGTGLKNWWLYSFYFIGLCQTKSIESQFKAGVRLFDIRINSRLDNVLESAHGLLRFCGGIEETLEWLSKKAEETGEEIWIRIILEQNYKMGNQPERDKIFCNHCEYLEEKYGKLNFFCGRRKYDFEELYRFKNVAHEPRILELYSSVTSLFKWWPNKFKILDDWCPFLYALINNRRIKKKYLGSTGYDYLMIDFI